MNHKRYPTPSKDINGEIIHTTDIVECTDSGIVGWIVYDEQLMKFGIKTAPMTIWKFRGARYLKIIGNMQDNPGLVEEHFKKNKDTYTLRQKLE